MKPLILILCFLLPVLVVAFEEKENTGTLPPPDAKTFTDRKEIVIDPTIEGVPTWVCVTSCHAWRSGQYRYVARACTSMFLLYGRPFNVYYIDVFGPWARVLLQYSGDDRFRLSKGSPDVQKFDSHLAAHYYDYRWEFNGDYFSRVLRAPTSHMMYYFYRPGERPRYEFTHGLVHNPDDLVR